MNEKIITKKLSQHDKRFDEVDKKLNRHDKRFDEVDKKLNQHDKRFDEVDKRFDSVDKRFDQIDNKFEQVYGQLDVLAIRTINLEGDMKEVKIKLKKLDEIEIQMDTLMQGQDKMIQILERVDQERIFTNEKLKEHDKRIGKLELKLNTT